MTRGSRAPATRSNLMRSRRRLAQVRKGAALLKRKRESLVDELFGRARTAVTSRESIDAQAREAWQRVVGGAGRAGRGGAGAARLADARDRGGPGSRWSCGA